MSFLIYRMGFEFTVCFNLKNGVEFTVVLPMNLKILETVNLRLFLFTI